MASLNRAILVGRVLEDPEARTTFQGTPMLRFKLRVDRPAEFSSRESSDIIEVVAWDKLAEQGKSVLYRDGLTLVEGRLQIRSFDGTDGKRRYATEVVPRRIQVIDKQPGKGAATPTLQATGPEDVDFADFEAEPALSTNLPF